MTNTQKLMYTMDSIKTEDTAGNFIIVNLIKNFI